MKLASELANTGRVTIPGEENYYQETLAVAKKWGADAVRNSDGTHLDADILNSPLRVYNAYFPTRTHNEFISQHMEECPQIFLMSERQVALDETLTIDYMATYDEDQLQPNYRDDPQQYWQVIDRTNGEVISPDSWRVNTATNQVVIQQVTPWHEYTVSFLAYIIWDPVEMYNHLVNDWGDKEHEIPFDVLQPHSNKFIFATLAKWLKENPEVDVVRFTTFFYQFSLVFNQERQEKFVDWFGYGASVSPRMLTEFAKHKGYHLTAEDFVDEGCYNSSFREPSQHYLDYIDFVQSYVSHEVGKMSALVHESGKEAMMFLGDQWIGAEPYGPHAKEMNLDAVVGSVGDGTTLRMISDIPNVRYTEGRFLPYFFPDTFYEGNDPSIEAVQNWVQARRAILRKPIDRMGYGGYLSLANKFPDFVETVANITSEFREIHANIAGTKPQSNLKVAILNSWGKLRTWQAFTVAHALYNKQAYSYYGILESLSGMNVDVSFISFDDILENGIDEKIDVIINAGMAGTAFSGGQVWQNSQLKSLLTAWVANGGGLLGVGEPSANWQQGQYFQLATVFGLDKECGFTLSSDKYFKQTADNDFLMSNQQKFDFGESEHNIYALSATTKILEYSNDEIHFATHDFGRGRTAYLAGLPFSFSNARLLMKTLYYLAAKENQIYQGYSSNINCEVNLYPETQRGCIVNNADRVETTKLYLDQHQWREVTLQPQEIQWFDC